MVTPVGGWVDMVFVLTPDKQKILKRRSESLAVFISFWSTHLSLERGHVGVIKYGREYISNKTILPLPVCPLVQPGVLARYYATCYSLLGNKISVPCLIR